MKRVDVKQLEPGMVELMDVREIAKTDITPNGVRHLAVMDDSDMEILGDFKLAIVASQDLAFGMARMFEALTGDSPPNVSVFRDMDSAKT